MRTPARVVVAASILLAVVGPAATATAEDPPLQTTSTWVVDVDAAAVRVTIEITAVDGSAFDVATLPLPAGATEIEVVADGDPVEVAADAPGVVDPPGSVRRVVVSFTLPDPGPREGGAVRVNPAYIHVPVPAWGESSSVRVELPDDYAVTTRGAAPVRSRLIGRLVLSVGAVSEGFVVEGYRDAGSTVALVEGAPTIVVRGWPGDDPWLEATVAVAETLLPRLAERVGLPWPVRRLVLRESAEPATETYGDRFTRGEADVLAGEELDAQLLLHVLGHAWFDEELFVDRWIAEGLAEAYAETTLVAAGRAPLRSRPQRPDLDDPAASPLADWQGPGPTGPADAAAEAWARDAAWWLVGGYLDVAGDEAMAAVLAAAAADEIAYRADRPAEQVEGVDDWRRFLDLLEEVGGVDVDEATFRLLTGADATLMGRRAAARSTYRRLEDAGDGWRPPLEVRRLMGAWRFPEAEEAMGEAAELLGRRDALVARANALGIGFPDGVEEAYEAADDLATVDELLRRVEEALVALEEAAEAVRREEGFLESIGAWGGGPRRSYAAAASAFQRGELGAAVIRAAEAVEAVDELTASGRQRLLLGGGVLLVLLVASVVGVVTAGRDEAPVEIVPVPADHGPVSKHAARPTVGTALVEPAGGAQETGGDDDGRPLPVVEPDEPDPTADELQVPGPAGAATTTDQVPPVGMPGVDATHR